MTTTTTTLSIVEGVVVYALFFAPLIAAIIVFDALVFVPIAAGIIVLALFELGLKDHWPDQPSDRSPGG